MSLKKKITAVSKSILLFFLFLTDKRFMLFDFGLFSRTKYVKILETSFGVLAIPTKLVPESRHLYIFNKQLSVKLPHFNYLVKH